MVWVFARVNLRVRSNYFSLLHVKLDIFFSNWQELLDIFDGVLDGDIVPIKNPFTCSTLLITEHIANR